MSIHHTEYPRVMKLVEQGYDPEAALQRVRTEAAQRAEAKETARRTPVRHPVPELATPAIAPQNEKEFQGMVEVVLRSEGWLVYHTYSSRRSEPGFPDICAVHPEHGLFFAELKMPRGTASPPQQRWLDAIQGAGIRAYLWKPEDWEAIDAVATGHTMLTLTEAQS